MTEEATPEQRRALFRVVRGEPTDAEIAALTAVLAATAAGGDEQAQPAPVSRWTDPVARLRTPLHPSPDAWRTSAWPR